MGIGSTYFMFMCSSSNTGWGFITSSTDTSVCVVAAPTLTRNSIVNSECWYTKKHHQKTSSTARCQLICCVPSAAAACSRHTLCLVPLTPVRLMMSGDGLCLLLVALLALGPSVGSELAVVLWFLLDTKLLEQLLQTNDMT